MMQAIDTNNLPTPKVEEWKFTNLPRAVPDGLSGEGEAQEEIIHISRGQSGGEVRDILFTGVDGTLHNPRLKVVLEEGAEFTFVERHEGEGSYWKNMITEIEVGANAKLHHIRFQEDSAEGLNTNMVSISLDRDATYDCFTLNLGGKLTRHEFHAKLNGPNSELTLNGLNLLQGKQHGDTTILIEHAAPHCRSNQFYRTVLDDEAKGVFQGKVHVHQIAQQTDGYQLSNAILLSPKAEMDTKPELEIYADDVKCSHGATTGQLDEEPLFYLRSRGLTAPEARILLMDAFVGEVIDEIDNEDLAENIREKAIGWLHKALTK